jgi:O-methyltransferase
MLLRLLKDIFFPRRQPAGLPTDEAGFERLMQDLVQRNQDAQALAVYDAAIAAGMRPCDPDFDRAYRAALQATGTPPYPLRRRSRFHELGRLLDETRALQGDIAECGCFRGLSSHLLLARLKRADPAFTGAGYHVFDSFEGLSDPSPADAVSGDNPAAERVRRMCKRGWFAAPLDVVKRGLAEFPGVEYHPGWIPQSFAGLPERRYRFVHLDLDLHDPTLAALEYFFPRLAPGAVVVCDDYDWPGERKAVDDFCARQGLTVATTAHGQAVLRHAR